MIKEIEKLLAESEAIIKRLALSMEDSKRLVEDNRCILAQTASLHNKITHQLQGMPKMPR